MSLQLTVSQIARAVDGRHAGPDAPVNGVGTDSRTLRPGELFIALKGERHDGHAFIRQAMDNGAAAAMVSEALDVELPSVRVGDCLEGLARLAAFWRERFSIPLVAVTGSNGKTTVKEMTAAILRRRGRVLATEGNRNNEIGMPLTLLNLGPEHRCGVIEMGANHAGEIARLCAVARPTVAVVTNAGPAHLEGFGSLDGVARAKGELFAGLPASAIAVINADDRYYPLWRELVDGRDFITFAMEHDAEVTASGVRHTGEGIAFELHAGEDRRPVTLALAGVHNVRNALAAAAAALAAGAGLDDVVAALAAVTPVRGRLCVKPGPNGARLIDDSYNANPSSLKAALETLADMPGEKLVVLGDMYELGEAADALHEDAGRWVKAAGVSRLYAVGEASRHAVQAFGAGGRHFGDRAALIAALKGDLDEAAPGACVLIKGSRGMAMEAVVEALTGGGAHAGGSPPADVKHRAAVAQGQG